MTAITPTAEQTRALEAFATGESLAIEAGAGTGKTATLTLLASSTRRRGQYIAFNRAIVNESKAKMPTTVACHTAHALAFREVGKNFKHRLDAPRMKSRDIAARLRLTPLEITTQDGEWKKLGEARLAGLVMRTLTAFCQSADLAPEANHVPYVNGIDIPPGAMSNNERVRAHIMPAVLRAWADAQDLRGSLPFTHDRYLKLWHLSGPRLNADFILFDEAQDANPVIAAIVDLQTHAQRVYVGDSQQQIYEFTGAVNALANLNVAHRTFLSQSFRFGPAVAAVANRVLADLRADLRLKGLPSIPSVVGPVDRPAAILTRTNATAVRLVLDAIKNGRRPHLVGGGREIVDFAKGAQALQNGQTTEHPDLACFNTWGEVQRYVEDDEQGGDLRLLVALIDEFTVEVILAALDGMTNEERADVIISTAHKSKGRQWDSVQLADDFPADPADEELRLLYVAVTRAVHQLDIAAVKYLAGAVSAAETPAEPTPVAPVAPATNGRENGTRDAEALQAIRDLCKSRDGTNNETILRQIQKIADAS